MSLINSQETYLHFDDYRFYLRPAQAPSASTFSTTATAPNLPGPGRVMGLGYDALGKILVSRISRLRAWFRRQEVNTDVQLYVPSNVFQAAASLLDEELEVIVGACVSHESFSTTATAPNLPGPGRVLGLVYDSLGNKLVHLLTKWAVRLGFGPAEASEVIVWKLLDLQRRIRKKKNVSLARIEDLSKADVSKLRKGCKGLLKYALKSNVLENQLIALQCVTVLAATDPAMRTLFLQMGASAKLGAIVLRAQRSKYEDADILLNRSRKALVSISDTNVTRLSDALQDMFFADETSYAHANMFLGRILACIEDQALSFLVLLSLMDLIDSCLFGYYDTASRLFDIASICDALERLISRPPEFVDWEDMDSLFLQWLLNWDTRWEVRCETSRILRIVCKFPERLPESVSYLNGQAEMLDMKEYEDVAFSNMPFSLWSMIEDELNTSDLTEVPRGRLQLDVLNYEHFDLSYVWNCFLCPASLLMRQFLLERHPLWDKRSGAPTSTGGNVERVLHPHRVIDIYQRMVALSDSPDASTRCRAMRFCRAVMKSDKYCWALLSSLPCPNHFEGQCVHEITSEDVSSYVNRGMPVQLYRHRCSAAEAPVNFRLTSSRTCAHCSQHQDLDWQVLSFPYGSVLWLDNTLKLSHDTNVVHHPLSAGRDEDGHELYVAGVFPDDRVYWKSVRFCVWKKDANSVTFDADGIKRRTYRFYVLVFRFDESLYAGTNGGQKYFQWFPA